MLDPEGDSRQAFEDNSPIDVSSFAPRRKETRAGRMRIPRRFRAHIEVVAGPPMDGRTATAAELERAVRGLRGGAS